MLRASVLFLFALAAPAFAQATADKTASAEAVHSDPLSPLDFLLGTWTAQTTGGSAGAQSTGTYTFARDLNGHELARTSSADSCKGPAGFNCQHHDQLFVFSDPNARAMHGSSLLAFYLDSEGHAIYYTVSLPDAHTAIFDSQGPASAPKFRLSYHLEGKVMHGSFAGAAPGSTEYHPYLEWTGSSR